MAPRSATLGIWVELAIWLSLAVAAFALTFQFSGEVGTYAWGAASWPRAVILLMAVGAVIQAVLRLRNAAAEDGISRHPLEERRPPLKLVAAFGLPLLFVFLLPKTGFYLTTPFFLLAYLILLGERRPLVLIGVTLLIYVLINLIFTSLLFVALPTGTWPGFYDFSNWFLATFH